MSQTPTPQTIPIWRLLLWAFVAVAGVYYLAPHSRFEFPLWICLLVTGGFIVGFGLLLNWARGSQSLTHEWVKARAPIILTVLVTIGAALRLWHIHNH